MKQETYLCHVVFQTHWDREWYFPFEVFRHRFIHVMERIVEGIETGDIERFVLDGQMAALEDYFEVCSDQQREKVCRLIKEEKLIVGPWYVLADEFLVSGESLWRNLELGLEMANDLGRSQRIGYLPDTFGHISQMPQILASFQLKHAVLWRGVQPSKSEFWWQSPDGSRVLTAFLPEGYYQPILNEEKPLKTFQAYVDKVKPYTDTKQLLLTNGGDHLMPAWVNMKDRMSQMETEEVKLIQSSYEQYFKSVEKECDELDVYEGELRSNDHIYLLPNVLSTRTYLKEQNQRMEDQLTRYVEPMLALAGVSHMEKYMQQTWKLLIQNHPHDSICGCSIDEVHREMETRTLKLSQRIEVLKKEAAYRMGMQDFAVSGAASGKPFEEMTQFVVFNPHAYEFNGWIEGEIWLYEERSFVVKNHKGEVLNTVVLDKKQERHFDSPTDAFPEFKSVWLYKLAIQVKGLPALSFQTFSIEEGKPQLPDTHSQPVIENEYMTVTLKEGELYVEDLTTGESFSGLNRLYSSLDAGDEYNYSPPVNDVVTKGIHKGTPEVRKSQDFQELRYSLHLRTPAALNAERTGPSENESTIEAHFVIRLYRHDPMADVQVKIVNNAHDQRLRLVFPANKEIHSSYSDTAFDVVHRPAIKEEHDEAEKLKEVPVVVEPSTSFIHVHGFSFVHRGLQEYQINSRDELEVTLIRGVGWLSRDDLRTRGGGAGPSFETPEAQCEGDYSFRYGFGFQGDAVSALNQANRFRYPPTIQSGIGGTPSLMTFSNPSVQISAVRQKDEGIEVRLWNPQVEPLETDVFSDYLIYQGMERCQDTLTIPAKGIRTLNLIRK
ncbi:glycoside hydrolase family 38 C-terminal domain-containing protein [Halobacillus kuroshimensis]|uniref:glycoside hydrolase family 38 N-terminal domain-containing protein n=1 Tax=Halobacillus kuroshimensis TaxID=302481 RepID=UPI00041D50AD|nr:glycoside hydrolase family 38 C-terminal domain-containing protein [Halobacillus kuroshimensis]